MRGADQESAKIPGIMAVGHWHRWAGAQLAHKGAHLNQCARHIRWGKGKDRMLAAGIGQGCVMIRLGGNVFGGSLRQGQAHAAGIIKGNGVAMHNLKGLYGIAAGIAFHRILAVPFDMDFRPDCIAIVAGAAAALGLTFLPAP